MEFSLDSYKMLARMAGVAHRTKDVPTAKDAFTLLWKRLDRETLDDHCVARETFNAEFARAYRSSDNPPCTSAPAPALDRAALSRVQSRIAARDIANTAKSVALDCAAFYAAKSPA